MKELNIKHSKILIGESFVNFMQYIPNNKVIIVTNDKVNSLYGKHFSDIPKIVIGQGEQIKNTDTIKYIINKLIEHQADRTTFLLGVGGGIVCDITGFVASIFMRGIDFGFIATTLLAQVDASIGGKNGVNFADYKNIVGTINQPKFVICDYTMLKTLDNNDLNCGFAEIIKYAIIDAPDMFLSLEENSSKALSLDYQYIEDVIFKCVEIKCDIVSNDEKETGERRKLNLGHTYGHAIEKITHIPHGNAVSIGLVMAGKLSVEKQMLSELDYQRIVKLLTLFKLPINTDCSMSEIRKNLIMDKKRESNYINFILINKIGDVEIIKIDIKDL